MSRSRPRTALLRVAVTVVLTAGSVAVGSVATAAPAELPPSLVDAVARDLNLSEASYLERADLGTRLAAFADHARTRFGGSFAGVWIEPDGSPVVSLTGGPDASDARAAAETAGFSVRDAGTSEAALRERASALDQLLAAAPPALADAVRGVSIDTVRNALQVRLSDTAVGLALPAFLGGVDVLFAPDVIDAPAVSIADPVAAPASMAGDAYTASTGVSGLRCSLGFNAVDGAGSAVNISAGHCDPDPAAAGTASASEARGTDGVRFGSVARASRDRHDFSVIRIDDAVAPRFQNNLVSAPGAAPVPITGTADPVVGAPVCKSGSTTGFTCGTVTSVGQTVDVGTRVLVDSFSTDICALQGDSGGAVISGTSAVGISSASNVGQYGVCQVADVVSFLAGSGPQLFATPIGAILADNPDLALRTS